MKSNKIKLENVKQAVETHKELLATIPLPPTGQTPQHQQLYVQHGYNDLQKQSKLKLANLL
eukprot:5516788-Ditylum_brightwellii.AAC.1